MRSETAIAGRSLRSAAAWACAVLALLAFSARAWALPPGREADVLALLQPLGDGATVLADVRVASIEIDGQGFTVALVDAAKHTAEVRFLSDADGRAAGGSRSFRIQLLPPPSTVLELAQERIRSVVIDNDHGDLARAQLRINLSRLETTPWPSQLARLLWLVLLLAVALSLWRLKPRPLHVVAFVLAGALATGVRLQLPFAPLHNNGHGLVELAIAIHWPQVARDATQRLVEYGAAWLQLQRDLTAVFGETHDALASIAVTLGALAAALCVAAAWAWSRRWTWTAMAAVVAIWTPVAVRIARSESATLVEQLLVALCLWLAARPEPAARVGVAVGLALLALGHALGPLTAVGLVLFLAALVEPNRRRDVQLWLLAVTIASALQVVLVSGTLGASVAETPPDISRALPQRLGLWLWPRLGQGAPVALALAFVGVFARPTWLRRALACAGFGLLALSKLGIHASQGTGYRYQAAQVGVICVALVLGGAGVEDALAGTPLWRRVVLAACALAIVAEVFVAPPPVLDAPAQAYLSLRQAFSHETGDIFLLVGPRAARGQRTGYEVPRGRLGPGQATLYSAEIADVARFCAATGAPPAQHFVWSSDACVATNDQDLPSPCEAFAPFVGERYWSHPVDPVVDPHGAQLEMQHYPPGPIQTWLARVRCPPLRQPRNDAP